MTARESTALSSEQTIAQARVIIRSEREAA
jgi:hypothetical protein